MERKFVFETDEYYHVYNRGTDKRQIFYSRKDYQRFLVLLHACNNRLGNFQASDWKHRELTDTFSLVKIKPEDRLTHLGAFCLMPNHFHILARAKDEFGISKFMLKVQTGYSMYFNLVHKRLGNLFSGKFKAQHINNDRYLRYLFAYIHLNPVKKIDPVNWERKIIPDPEAARRYLNNFGYSSYKYYLGFPDESSVILSAGEFPAYFEEENTFEDFINDWMAFEG